MANLQAFQPQGNTVLVAATSSTAGAERTQLNTGGIQGAYVNNPTTSPVYLAFGSSTVQAACPTTGVSAVGVCVTQWMPQMFTVPPSCYVSAVTSAGAAGVFVTPGFGT